jgi:lipid-A-disaccharide synthase
MKVAVITGEESGDLLGANLISELKKHHQDIEIIGIGGTHLQKQNLNSLFDPAEIALMGVSAIIKKLPRLIYLISKTARFILKQQPDCLILIDSPEFSHRVAKKVRAQNPNIKIINYVCPSVWAWRPSRARKMREYIDHILAILPFEPEVLRTLNGPNATYVGHPASTNPDFITASQHQLMRPHQSMKNLVILPGSRMGEIKRHMHHMGETIKLLDKAEFAVFLPTLPHLVETVKSLSQNWHIKPHISTDYTSKIDVFSKADIALAVSGTVTLELALCRVPTIAIYDFDVIARLLTHYLFCGWSASLPNLIADEAIVPEYYNDHIKYGMLARQIKRLSSQNAARTAQLEGFTKIRHNMTLTHLPIDIASQTLLKLCEKQ